MKKILFTASRASHIQNFHIPYLQDYHSQGWQVHVVTQGRLELDEVDVLYELPFYKKTLCRENLSTIAQLARILKRERYDLICSHATLAGIVTRAAMQLSRCRAPLVHVCHGYLFGQERSAHTLWHAACEKITSRPIRLLLVMNQEDEAIALRRKLARRIVKIPGMGLDASRFPDVPVQQLSAYRQSLGLAKGTFSFLCIGEFSSRKNQPYLLRCFAKVVQKHPTARLLFAGEGDLLPQCRQLARELKLENTVTFLGQVTEMNELVRSVDAVVSVSISEGLPFNILEALYCHIPVVASAVKGHSDLLEDKKNALLFRLENPDDLVHAMERLLSDRDIWRRIQSQAFLLEEYRLSHVLPEILRLYNSVLNFDKEEPQQNEEVE